MTPLAIELANTTYAVRGDVRDGLRTTGDLAAFLDRVADRLPAPVPAREATEQALATARALRDAIRAVARSVQDGATPDPAQLDTIGEAAALAPHWNELRPGDPVTKKRTRSAPPVDMALAEIAENAVDLFTGGGNVRFCGRPGCVLLFVKDHPRREWCSNGCGNKVRAARHYDRVRKEPAGG